MINFRFHIVSLIAVFLALALGVIFGSTVVDRAIVDGLRNRIDRVEKNADAQRAENDALRAEVDRLEQYVEDVAPFAVRNSLTARAVSLVAMRGIDDAAVGAQAELARGAGARIDGILWLEDAWNLSEPEQSAALRTITGSDASGRALRTAGLETLATRLASGAPAAGPDVLAQMLDAGFVSLAGLAGGDAPAAASYPGSGPVVLLAGGPTSTITPPAFARNLARALAGVSVPTAVGEVWAELEGGGERGAWLAPVLDDAALADRVSTADDLDLTEGRVAVLLALSDLPRGIVGHYGYGAGAQAPLPEPVTTPVAR